MIKVEICSPTINKSPLGFIAFDEEKQQEIELAIEKRIASIDSKNKIIYTFVVLKDGSGREYLVPVKYYMWLGCGQVKTASVLMRTFKRENLTVYTFEIKSLDYPDISTIEDVKQPLTETCKELSQNYIFEYTRVCSDIRLVFNNQYSGYAFKMGYCTIDKVGENIPVYFIGDKNSKDLRYRKIDLNGETYLTDLEVV